MDAIASIPLIGGFLSTVLAFVAVLGIVVFVHEYGHYIVARWCGIRSEVFSIGFGPVLWSRRDRRGTLWQVAALPLGGYVKFLGDSDGSSRADPDRLAGMSPEEREHSFHGASVWRRMLTVLAGPFANFVLTIAVFAGVVLWQGVAVQPPTVGSVADLPGIEQPLRPGDVILAVEGRPVADFAQFYAAAMAKKPAGPVQVRIARDGAELDLEVPYPLPALVQTVDPLSPASSAGIEAGDLILSADGQRLQNFEDLRRIVLASGDRTIPLTVWRDGAEMELEITPRERDTGDGAGGFERRVMIGVGSGLLYQPEVHVPAPWAAVGYGTLRMFDVITQSLNGLKHIILGTISAENLQGPLGIAQISGEAATQGFLSFVVLIGVISTAIGLLNLFPIPVLDGGHFMAFAIEAIRGRPPSPAIMQIAMSIGLGLILLLMVFATYNDIIRLMRS